MPVAHEEFVPRSVNPGERSEQPSATPAELFYFELSFAERVRLTSIRSAGGDWCWRLCAADGTVLAHGGGYRTETECRAAISVVQRVAGAATIRQR
nr:YegP family protein [Hephaestia mangrovi]